MKYYLVQYRMNFEYVGWSDSYSEMFEYENTLTPLECFKHSKEMLELKHKKDVDGEIQIVIENMTLIPNGH